MTTEPSRERKRVVILGATGSIGESALKVARDIPERMEIVGLAAKTNAQKFAAAANEVRPESVCLVDETQIDVLRKALDYKPRIFSGEAGLLEIACLTNVDMVLVAIVGTGGLRPALAAIEAGKDLAVASKEILVMAGRNCDACGARPRRARFAGGQRAQRDLSMPRRQTRRQMSDGSSLLRPVVRSAKRRAQISIRSRRNRR